jgi:hypothetical protein
MAQYGLD